MSLDYFGHSLEIAMIDNNTLHAMRDSLRRIKPTDHKLLRDAWANQHTIPQTVEASKLANHVVQLYFTVMDYQHIVFWNQKGYTP
jgi:hypothetical protein